MKSSEINTTAQAIAYIHSLPRLHPDKSLQYVQRALTALKNPQQKIKTVHVTGTNGKGSVCYYLTNLLVNSGFKVGTFASPYVKTFNERIQINGKPIDDAKLLLLTQKIMNLVTQIQKENPDFYLVEFEFLTVMMFEYFAHEKVDFGIVEVGIGGEHDKTNVITPELAIITNIGMDHAQLIGPTLSDIAQEKAGIIKFQKPVILGEIPSKVQSIIDTRAKQQQAPVYQLGKHFKIEQIQLHDVSRTSFTWNNQTLSFKDLQIASFAPTQVIDAALAVQAYLILCPQATVSNVIIQKSLAVDNLPGRTQIISRDPLIILDGAHNEPAIRALITNLGAIRQQRRVVVLYAAMVDKQRQNILEQLEAFADEIIITTLDEARAAKSSDYQDLKPQEHFIQPWPVAFAQAVTSLESESMLVICGSLHFASAILDLLKPEN